MPSPPPHADVFDGRKGEFKLMVDFIKSLPGGQTTDFVLVSCSGGSRVGLDGQERDKVMGFKRKGAGDGWGRMDVIEWGC